MQPSLFSAEAYIAIGDVRFRHFTGKHNASPVTTPLEVMALCGRPLALIPVPMANGFPSGANPWYPSLWVKFLKSAKPLGLRRSIRVEDVSRIQGYVRKYQTEALSEDGLTALTIAGYQLVECESDVCAAPADVENFGF